MVVQQIRGKPLAEALAGQILRPLRACGQLKCEHGLSLFSLALRKQDFSFQKAELPVPGGVRTCILEGCF